MHSVTLKILSHTIALGCLLLVHLILLRVHTLPCCSSILFASAYCRIAFQTLLTLVKSPPSTSKIFWAKGHPWKDKEQDSQPASSATASRKLDILVQTSHANTLHISPSSRSPNGLISCTARDHSGSPSSIHSCQPTRAR